MSLIKPSAAYRPMHYQWAYDFWKRQQQIHWLVDEIPMSDDIRDYNGKLTPEQRNLVDHIFRFFTQADIDVLECYHKKYQKIFKPIEVQMMLTAFSNMETIHIDAYSNLLTTLGIPDSEFTAFNDYKAMKDKSDWFKGFSPSNSFEVARTLAAVSGFGEGLALFGSFAILLNLPRQNLLKGMGQVVTWSVRDETLHCEGIMKLFHAWLSEHPEIDRSLLRESINAIAEEAVAHEYAFIDLAFEAGDVPGMTREDIKSYIRFIGDLRLRQLGCKPIFKGYERNPLPWIDAMLNAPEHANFFEARPTEYTKAATTGSWDDVWN